MNDNALITAVIAAIGTGLTARGMTVGIKQDYQPTQQGTPSKDTVFVHNLGTLPYGYPQRKDVFDTVAKKMMHTEARWFETTFQASALATQDPRNQTQLTANDYIKAVATTMESDATRVTLSAAGIGILRVPKITQTFFKDDRGQFEASPSVEFTVTHSDTFSQVIGSTDVINGLIVVANA